MFGLMSEISIADKNPLPALRHVDDFLVWTENDFLHLIAWPLIGGIPE